MLKNVFLAPEQKIQIVPEKLLVCLAALKTVAFTEQLFSLEMDLDIVIVVLIGWFKHYSPLGRLV